MTSRYNQDSFMDTLWHFLPGIIKTLSIIFIIVNIFLLANAAIDGSSGNTSYVYEPKLVRTENYTTGKLDSPVTYVYFVDYQCPACKQNNEPFSALKEEYKDKIRFVYKHNPLTEIHPNAKQAALAVQASFSQNKFIEMGNQAFANQSSLGSDSLEKYAAATGLDMSKWKAELTSKKNTDAVLADQKDLEQTFLPESTISKQTKPVGEGAGTPTSVIMKNNVVIDWWTGGQDPQTIKNKLDEALK